MQPKTKCEYCKGVTTDDESGNCSACGAPRAIENHIYSRIQEMHNPLPFFRYGSVSYSAVASTSCDVGYFFAST